MSWKALFFSGLFGLSLLASLSSGVSEGRHGNERLRSGDATAADSIYNEVLQTEGLKPWLQARLYNNLGLARALTSRSLLADSAFSLALSLEAEPQLRAAIAYNAGTTALQAEQFDAAITYLRRVLILTPNDSLARRNLEIALRRRDSKTDHLESEEPPEPSAFAQQVKARADSLILRQKYLEALTLMRSSAAHDSTIYAFQGFMERLDGIVRIDTAQ